MSNPLDTFFSDKNIRMLHDEVLMGDNEERVQLYKWDTLYLTINEAGQMQFWQPTWTGTEEEQSYTRRYMGFTIGEELWESDYFIAGYAEPVKVLPAAVLQTLSI